MKDKQRMKNCPELNGVYNLVKFSGQMGFVSFRVIEIETLRSQTEHLGYKDLILNNFLTFSYLFIKFDFG